MNQVANQTEYGQIKAVSFTIDQWVEKNDIEI